MPTHVFSYITTPLLNNIDLRLSLDNGFDGFLPLQQLLPLLNPLKIQLIGQTVLILNPYYRHKYFSIPLFLRLQLIIHQPQHRFLMFQPKQKPISFLRIVSNKNPQSLPTMRIHQPNSFNSISTIMINNNFRTFSLQILTLVEHDKCFISTRMHK